MKPGETAHGAVALRFAQALQSGSFDIAHSLLAAALSKETSAADLKARYGQMIAYGEAPANHVEVMNTLEDWPDKRPNDIGWAYVAIGGLGYSEAVTVIVTDEGLIRDVEWGRP